MFAEIVTDDEARGTLASCGVVGIEYLEEIGQTEATWKDNRERFLAQLTRPALPRAESRRTRCTASMPR